MNDWENITSDPDFQKQDLATKTRVLDNFFSKNVESDPKFQELPEDRRLRIRNNFALEAGIGENKTKGSWLGKSVSDMGAGQPIIAGDRGREFIKNIEGQPEASWGEVLSSIPSGAINQTAAGVGGVAQAVGEGLGLPKVAQWGKDVSQGIEQIQREEQPNIKSGAKGAVYGAGVSVLQNLMTLPLSIATGNPIPSLAAMGLITTGQGYREAREGGLNPAKSLLYGVEMGGAEAATEALPTGTLIKHGLPLAKRMITHAIQEVFGETANTIYQDAARQVALKPNATIGDFLTGLPPKIRDTVYQTLISSPFLSGASHVMVGDEEDKPKPLYDNPVDFAGTDKQEAVKQKQGLKINQSNKVEVPGLEAGDKPATSNEYTTALDKLMGFINTAKKVSDEDQVLIDSEGKAPQSRKKAEPKIEEPKPETDEMELAVQAKKKLEDMGIADNEEVQKIVDTFLDKDHAGKTMEQLLDETVQQHLSDQIKQQEQAEAPKETDAKLLPNKAGSFKPSKPVLPAGLKIEKEETDAKLLPNKAGVFEPSKPTPPAGIKIEKEETAQPKPEKFHITKSTGFTTPTFIETEGEKVELPGFEDINFFAHKAEDGETYKVTEVDSGLEIASGTNKEEATAKAIDVLTKHGKEETQKAIAAQVDSNGITPTGARLAKERSKGTLFESKKKTEDVKPEADAQKGTSQGTLKEPATGGPVPNIPVDSETPDQNASASIVNKNEKQEDLTLKPETQRNPPTDIVKPNIGTIDNINTIALSKVFKARIDKGDKLNKLEMKKIVGDLLGVKVGALSANNPIYKHKAIEEAFEYAIVLKGREIVASNLTTDEKYEAIKKVYENQPILGERTSETIKNQAYSTPLPIAFLLNEHLGIDTKTSVLGLTAGNGMLLVGANINAAAANDIDPTYRGKHLADLGFTVTNEDALKFMDTHESYTGKFDVVVENPPFGKAPETKTYDGFPVSKLEHQIILENLKGMKDKGEAAFIIGGHNFKDGKMTETDRIFLNYLYSHYNISHNIDVNGDVYSRMGTKFPIRIITIAGKKQVPDKVFAPSNASRVESAQTFDDIRQILSRESEVTRGDNGDQPTRSSDEIGEGAVSVTEDRPIRGESETMPDAPGARTPVPVRPKVSTEGRSETDRGEVGKPDGETKRSGESKQPGVGNKDVQPLGPSDGLSHRPTGVKAKSEKEEINTNEHQVAYESTSKGVSGGNVAPKNIAETVKNALGKMSETLGDIDDYVMNKLQYKDRDSLFQAFSAEQIDALALAIYNIDNGWGLIVGDQTGVGKGRVIAGVIKYANLLGLKPVFLTAKPNLFSDIYRDLVDIGHPIKPYLLHGDQATKIVDADDNVLFRSQYAKDKTAIAGDPSATMKDYDAIFSVYTQFSKTNAQQQIIRELAAGNVVIMDESHEASGDSKRGKYMTDVLGSAKAVVYSSATYAKRPDTMSLYFRTALGSSGMDVDSLIDAMNRGGVVLQQVVAKQLADGGQYIRRELNFDGITFETVVDTKKRSAHREQADAIADILWYIVRFDEGTTFGKGGVIDKLNSEAEEEGVLITGKTDTSAGVTSSNFSSTVHNLVGQMLLGLKVDSTVEMAIEAIKANKKPVIAMMNTMGTFLGDLVSSGDLKIGDEVGLTFRDVLTKALRSTLRYTRTDHTGKETRGTLTKADLPPDALMAYERIEKMIENFKTDIPASPIDYIMHKIRQAGYSIGEITGRQWIIDYSTPKPTLGHRTSTQIKDRNSVVNKFNGGQWKGAQVRGTDALLINAAGATGLSVHASIKVGDRRSREMIIIQPNLNIDVFFQTLGRVFRKGLAVDEKGKELKPTYKLLQTDLPTEIRPAVVLKKKMASLNANTTADSDSSMTMKDVPDMMNVYGDEVVFEYLMNNASLNSLLGDPLKLMDSEAPSNKEDAYQKVTGKLALLSSKLQEQFYAEVEHAYNELIERLNERGENTLATKDYDFKAKIENRKVIHYGTDESNPFSSNAYLEKVTVNVLKRPHNKAKLEDILSGRLKGEGRQSAADKINADMIADIRSDAKEYLESVKENHTPERFEQLKQTNSLIVDRIAEKLNRFRIGHTYRLDSTFLPYSGVLVDIRRVKSGNPAAMSKVKLVFATNTNQQTNTIALSRDDELSATMHIDDTVPEDWDSTASQTNTEVRHIITGNILAGFDRLKHKAEVINYTTHTGERKMGILVPRSIDVGGEFSQSSVGAKEAYEILTKNKNRVSSTDGDVSVSYRSGRYNVIVPKSKLRGAKYFLNESLLETTTGGFSSFSSSGMIAYVDADRLMSALEVLNKELGVRFLIDAKEEAPPPDNDGGGVPVGAGTGEADAGEYSENTIEDIATIRQNLINGTVDLDVSKTALAAVGKILNIPVKSKATIAQTYATLAAFLGNDRGYALLAGEPVPTIEDQLTKLAPKYSGGEGDVGGYAEDEEVEDKFVPIEGPELLELAKQINEGKVPIVARKLRAMAGLARGYFRHTDAKEGVREGEAEILIAAHLFAGKDVVKVLAHEIGHLVDWLSNKTLGRGNIFGHLLSLKKYLTHTIDSLPGVKKEEIMKEMRTLAHKWKPIQKTMGPAFVKYRLRPTELYADAVSVLFNNPKMFEKYAPKSFELFLKGLKNKPVVEAAYNAIQARIKEGPAVVALRRQQNTLSSYAKAEASWAQPIRDMEPKSLGKAYERFVEKFKQELVDRHSPIYSGITDDKVRQKVRNAIEDFLYHTSESEAYFEEVEHKIIAPFIKSGITEQQLGEYMERQRVVHERQKIANPGMHNVKTSEEALGVLKNQMGGELYAKMESLAEQFWQIRKALVVSRLKQSGMYTEKLMKLVEENEKYAKFTVEDYITTDTKLGYGSGISSKIHKQYGTLKGIANPFTATIMQDLSLLRSVIYNNAVKTSITALRNHGAESVDLRPAEVTLKKMPNGTVVRVPVELPANAELQLLSYMENGKVVGWYVPKDMAESFEANPIEASGIIRLMSGINRLFKELFTRKNPGFWPFNITKDTLSAVKILPKASLHKFIPIMIESLGPAYKGMTGYDDITQDILTGKGLVATINRDGDSETTQLERLRRGYAGAGSHKGNMFRRAVVKFMDWLNFAGEFSERVTKIAAYKYLNKNFPEMSREDKMHLVRWVGSPAYLVKGKSTPIANSVLLFFNPFVQGTRIHMDAMKQRPLDYWWKTVKYNILPKVMMQVAAHGLVDSVLRSMFASDDDDKWSKLIRNISKYNLLNYVVVPIAWTTDKHGHKKAIYLRVPQDEVGRVVGGIVSKLGDIVYRLVTNKEQPIGMSDLVGLLDYGIGQLPMYAPALSAAINIGQYVSTGNAYDSFTGDYAMPREIADTKSSESLKYFSMYLANKLGIGVVRKFNLHDDVGKTKSSVEKILGYPIVSNIVGRFVQVSDVGIREEYRDVDEKVRTEEARHRRNLKMAIININNGTPVESLSRHQIEALDEFAITHTDKEVKAKFEELEIKKINDPLLNAIQNARSNKSRAAIIKKADELGEL